MHSLRTKITLFTVIAIIVALTVATVISVFAIKDLGSNTSNQLLYLLCVTGEKNLDTYFESVQQSVETVSSYAEADLETTGLDRLDEHMERVEKVFEKTANNTVGVLTYYYRVDPAVTDVTKGFWYVNLNGDGFVEHEVTDITLYDTDDQTKLVWFTVPKATGEPIWQSPYFTDNLDEYVFSYNVPIYKGDLFIGVIGIEIDYETIIEPVDSIELYNNGYAFINDNEGNIIYHPRMAIEDMIGENKPQVPDGMITENTYFEYDYEGIAKQAVWLPLSNGMRLNVSVPISEINESWHKLVTEAIIVSLVMLLVFIIITMRLTRRITRPLRELTYAAKQVDAGNYDVEFDHGRDESDEVGILANTFGQLVSHLKIYISDLNSLAFADALTSVHNKGAFDIYVRDLQARIDNSETLPVFAIGIFDCDDLKLINDRHGHEEGDELLKNASAMICGVFQHSPVFRIGGDEFAVILQNNDFAIRDDLIARFEKKGEEGITDENGHLRMVRISMGVAVFDPESDKDVHEVIRRADELMYENKRKRKAGRGKADGGDGSEPENGPEEYK